MLTGNLRRVLVYVHKLILPIIMQIPIPVHVSLIVLLWLMELIGML